MEFSFTMDGGDADEVTDFRRFSILGVTSVHKGGEKGQNLDRFVDE